MENFVERRVHYYYWDQDVNCATTALLVLSEYFNIELEAQVVDSAIGMHGAGGFRAQCGLVEGSLMFIGILGRLRSIEDKLIVSCCKEFAERFISEFKSLECKVLRPQGFKSENPPHLCEELTMNGIIASIRFISDRVCQDASNINES